MSNSAFGVIAFCALLGTVGALVAFFPRAIPRMTNAYYGLIHMKSRLAEEDYDRVGIRVAGGVLFSLALYVLISRWSQLWK
jgi:hypothetical protein